MEILTNGNYTGTLADKIRGHLPKILGKTMLLVALGTGVYLVGYNNGVQEGRSQGKVEIITSLSMHRYDTQQFAKYASSLKEQERILSDAAAINRVLELLELHGHLKKDVPEHVRKEAIGYR